MNAFVWNVLNNQIAKGDIIDIDVVREESARCTAGSGCESSAVNDRPVFPGKRVPGLRLD